MPTTIEIHSASCNNCQSDQYSVLYGPGQAQVNQIVRCRQCGLMYAFPRRPADHVQIESWPDDPNWNYADQHPQRFEKERLQVRDYAGARKWLNRVHPNRGTLVEVGSSLGFLLDAFRADGWDVLGIEPDKNACRHATQTLGLKVSNATLESANLPSESTDVLVMLHVIEHVPNPVATLREIHRVLKPGGHLVLETPRYDTLMFKLLGRRERSLSCDGHIFFFTTDSLRTAYTKAGFDLEHLEYPPRSLTLDRLLYNVGVISKSASIQRMIGVLSRGLFLNKIRLSANVRDMQRVYLRKPTSGN
jgi:2-polyprenyl-3-methyl-5-hydroxy-6-metoxy-1,4-benzoquinol methylase